MEKLKPTDITTPLQKLDLNHRPTATKISTWNYLPSSSPLLYFNKKRKPPSLESLCLGVVGKHLEDIVEDLPDIAFTLPPDIKMKLVAVAKRKGLLNDDVIIALADSSWEILDISGSDISDLGLFHVVNTCKALRSVDLSRCDKLSVNGITELLQQCPSLETLRWGGCPASERVARRCVSSLKPKLHDLEGESWEELDTTEIAVGAQLRWLVWPKVDKDSLECLSVECPRIIVNPKPSPFGYRGVEVPLEALPNISLDDPIIQDIDPKTWAVRGFISKSTVQSASDHDGLSMAEKFRLAFLERDARLAPKRAKNARQRQRRAGKEWLMSSSTAKAIALASQASKSLNYRS